MCQAQWASDHLNLCIIWHSLHAASELSKLSKFITMKLKCSHPDRIHVFASAAELPRLQTKVVLFKISVVRRVHVCVCP